MGVEYETNIENEIWKDIEGFSNYQISNQGRVKNKNTDLILHQQKRKKGYVKVELWKDGKGYTRDVHRLVGKAFIPNPENKPDINHIDTKKDNNWVTNLEWVTKKENIQHAINAGTMSGIPIKATKASAELSRTPIRIIETGEVFNSISDCAKAINSSVINIVQAMDEKYKNHHSVKGLHFERVENNTKKPFLYDFQMDAVNRMFNGCILAGGTGSGKSRTGLYYYFKEYGGSIINGEYVPMKDPRDLYIITTAKKRNDCEWTGELANYLMSPHEDKNELYNNKIIVDSWNNIQKYTDVVNAFFIFDEDKVQGNGSWVKSFLKITKSNKWIILSATSGDVWMDYVPVFIANGFYRNRTEFCREHVVYSRFTKYPKIERYVNTGRLLKLRSSLLIDMDFERKTVQNREDIYVGYDPRKYRDIIRTRWDPYKNEPIEQAAGLCYVLRRIVNEDESRQVALLELFEKHPKMIVFYSYDYEREILLKLAYGNDVTVAQYNGHVHDKIPDSNKWVYLVNYNACEGWNCITTDTIVFYSQTYSYKTLLQAEGRIYRLNTPFKNLYYYNLKSRSGIDLAIAKALREKKNFNEGKWAKWTI